MAEADRTRAADEVSAHMRGMLARSAEAWGNRAELLDRLEASSIARAEAVAGGRETFRSEGEAPGHGSTPEGEAQAEGAGRRGERGTRPRITGLGEVPERKDDDAD